MTVLIYTYMINRYNEFLLESHLLKLDESIIYFSDEFIETLKRIKSNISDELLAMNSHDKKTDINYIDVTDNADQLSFIPDAKTDELLQKPVDKGWERAIVVNPSRVYQTHHALFKKLKLSSKSLPSHPIGTKGWAKNIIVNLGEEYDNKKLSVVHFKADLSDPNVGEHQDSIYASDDNDPGVKYIDQYKEITKLNKSRNPIKVGRLVKRLLQIGGYPTTDKQIEDFVNQYKATFQILKDKYRNFKMVEGDILPSYYSEDSYVSTAGSLGNSCMKYKSCQSYFKLYTENPQQIKMLILLDPLSEKIKGRALIWSCELISDNNEKITFMDRIYTNEDSDVIQFTNYATENGWYYKQVQQSTELFNLEGKDTVQDATLFLSVNTCESEWEFPYLDTFKYLNPSNNQLSNKKHAISDYGETVWKLESQEGTNGQCKYCDGGLIVCSDCGGSGKDECTDCDGTGSTYCYKCEEEGEVTCNNCHGDGCSLCDDKGKITCTQCDGSKQISCDSCSGEGKTDCKNCHGEGDFDCSECS